MRYFFDTADGGKDIDNSGVELGSDDEAVSEATKFAGSMISDDPAILAAENEFIVTVRREGSGALARIRVQLEQPAAG